MRKDATAQNKTKAEKMKKNVKNVQNVNNIKDAVTCKQREILRPLMTFHLLQIQDETSPEGWEIPQPSWQMLRRTVKPDRKEGLSRCLEEKKTEDDSEKLENMEKKRRRKKGQMFGEEEIRPKKRRRCTERERKDEEKEERM